MTIKRRSLLKNICGASVLLTSGSFSMARQASALARENTGTPIIHLQTNTLMDQAFDRGVANASASSDAKSLITSLSLSPEDLLNSTFVHQFFSRIKDCRVMGIMEDAGFSIFQTMARSVGARFLYTGQHSWGGDGPYDSRHQIQSVSKYQGTGIALQSMLSREKPGYFISETSLGKNLVRPAAPGHRFSNETNWAALMAEALTRISLDQWSATGTARFERRGPATPGVKGGQLAAFVIEL